MFDNNIPIVVDPGATGAFWDGSKVVLGEGYDNAAVLVHETNHAHYTVEDRNPDIDDDSRDDYVGSLIAQETDGTVQQILADREFDDVGHDLGTQPGETEYWAAHDQAIADGKSETEAGQAGYDAVHELFTSGGFVTSTTGESYPDYYGGAWDDAH